MSHILPDSIPASMQELPPHWAHFCLGIESFLLNELGVELQGKKILVAFSGGIDSTALLLTMKYIGRRRGGRVLALHLDHGLRQESEEDAKAAEAVCHLAHIPCFVFREDVRIIAKREGIGLEDAGRRVRYALLEKVRNRESADYIVLGHHLGDLCEDVLMRIIRGAGWPGISGMPGVDTIRHIVRPFLLTPKKDLRDFLHELGVPWQQDASNTDLQWKRNRVRHNILPLFLEENQSFPDAVARMWRMGRLDAAFWQERVAKIDSGSLISVDFLESVHQAERMRCYKVKLDELGSGQVLADSLFRLDAAWREKRFGAVIQFPGEKTAKIVSAGVVFGVKH